MKQMTSNRYLLGIACSLALIAATPSANATYDTILSSINNSLASDSTIGAYDIEVHSRQGRVILKGFVTSEASRERAIQIAKNTAGVREVKDWLTVAPAQTSWSSSFESMESGTTRSDSAIASDIATALSADNRALSSKVKVDVFNGTAKLKGDLNNFREADQALSTTLMVAGVKDISSELTINGRSYDTIKFTR